MAAKPRVIELVEKFIVAEHRLGKTQLTITEELQQAARWWGDAELVPSVESTIEREAIAKLGGALIDKAVSRHVDEILNS
jgi:ribosome biogenesis SPOUT family RNA methylase Rps3